MSGDGENADKSAHRKRSNTHDLLDTAARMWDGESVAYGLANALTKSARLMYRTVSALGTRHDVR